MLQVITLTDQEVTEAIIDYASKHGVKFEGMQADVSVIAGRKENGTYATIDLKPKQNVLPPHSVETIVISKTDEEEDPETILSEGFEEHISSILKEDEPDDEEELFS